MDQSVRFWDRFAERYSRQPIADEAAYQKKLQVTREYFRPDMAVLEFGCGTGSTALSHAPYVKQIHAIDASSKMIEIARNKVEPTGLQNISFACSSIDDYCVPEGSLDAVLGLSVLHLLGNVEEVIGKVHRMLKPGGVFVSSSMCIGDTMRYLKWVAPIGQSLGLMPSLKIFTLPELTASLTGAGFAISHQWQPGKNKSVFIVATKVV